MTEPNRAPALKATRCVTVNLARASRTMRNLVLLAIVLYTMALGAGSASTANEAQAAHKLPVTIKILFSSRTEACFDPGDAPAIRQLATLEQERINEQGGIGGRRLALEFLDDERDADQSIANMRSAIADPDALALIGLPNSNLAKQVFEAVGGDIKRSQIPFLSFISINSIFADYPNVFTTRASQDDERIPVLIQFMRASRVQQPAFLGIKDNLFSTVLADGLKRALNGTTALVADHRLGLTDEKLDPAEIAGAVEDLKQRNPDLLFLSVGGNRNAAVIKELLAAKVTPALFVGGRTDDIPREIADAYPSDIYQIAWDRLPDVYNDRLRQLIWRSNSEQWIFEGRKNPGAPGWKSGECKPRPDDAKPDPLSDANLRAIGVGAQYADMVGLIAAAARTASLPADVATLRAHLVEQLKTAYATGRGTYPGSFDNWSFRTTTRAAARTPFIVRLAPGLGRTQLAPVQFVRLRNETLRAVSTFYLDIDLIRAFRIDDNEKSFFAEFYLSLHDDGKGASIDEIEFSNAFLDPQTNDRHLTVRILSDGGKSEAYPDDMKIYQVSGKFMFEPKLANYPFDTQRLSIDIRPKHGNAPFIIQPPPQSLRDLVVGTDGWQPKEQYVGYDEDFVSTIDAETHEQSVVPFYKASFVWLMARETTDFFLRVVVPLGFILIVAYLSIFIPRSHFEAIVTIQVTALLSAVALYLSLPQIDADTTTLSDRMFLFSYMAVSFMIGISILRINPTMSARVWLRNLLATIHIVTIPASALLMALYVYQSSLAAGDVQRSVGVYQQTLGLAAHARELLIGL